MKIIDGHNVIGAAAAFGIALSQEDKEERLLRLLAAWRSRRRVRERVLVVFDGSFGRLAAGPRRFTRGGIEVEAAVGEPADALILRRVRAAANAREIELVSSDQALGREAAGRGARVVRSQAFLAAVGRALEHGPPPEKPEAPTPDEVAEWLEKFSGG